VEFDLDHVAARVAREFNRVAVPVAEILLDVLLAGPLPGRQLVVTRGRSVMGESLRELERVCDTLRTVVRVGASEPYCGLYGMLYIAVHGFTPLAYWP
jgi:hypothetical protein